MISYLFILLAVFAIATALAMIISRNTVNSALFLVLNLVSLAGIYLLLQAHFLAVIQILVYAGAIMVLFLFTIMLLNIDAEKSLFTGFRVKYFFAFIFGVIICSQILYGIGSVSNMLPQVVPEMTDVGTVEAIGEALYSEYILPFHIVGLLLTAAASGAILIAEYRIKSLPEGND